MIVALAPSSAQLRRLTLVAGLASLLTAPAALAAWSTRAGPAVEAPSASIHLAPERRTRTARVEPLAGVVGDGDLDRPACERSRKRLFVEGEGWIVRRISLCR